MARILIVDDDPLLLKATSAYLSRADHEVLEAQSGQEGLQQATKASPDVIILDIMMPDMDGYEVCRQLRANPQTASIPILMLTARTQVMDKLVGFKAGADDYLTKPAHMAELLARVEAMLARSARAPKPKAWVISFIGAKGGVGTTTVAVNAGVTLALKDKTTILIDLRPDFGTAALQLNASSSASLGDVLDLQPSQVGEQQWHRLLLPHSSGLKLVASRQDICRPVELPASFVKNALTAYKTMADFVLLDLPPGGSAANREALGQSHYVILVTEPEPTAATAAQITLRFLDSIAIRGSMVGMVVVNQNRSGSTIPVADLAAYLNVEVLATIPPNPEAAFEAARRNTPLSLLHLDSTTSFTFEQLADRLTAAR